MCATARFLSKMTTCLWKVPLQSDVNKPSFSEFLSDKPSYRDDCETRPAAGQKQKTAKLLGRGLDQLGLKGLFYLWSCWQAVQCAPRSQLVRACHPCWGRLWGCSCL